MKLRILGMWSESPFWWRGASVVSASAVLLLFGLLCYGAIASNVDRATARAVLEVRQAEDRAAAQAEERRTADEAAQLALAEQRGRAARAALARVRAAVGEAGASVGAGAARVRAQVAVALDDAQKALDDTRSRVAARAALARVRAAVGEAGASVGAGAARVRAQVAVALDDAQKALDDTRSRVAARAALARVRAAVGEAGTQAERWRDQTATALDDAQKEVYSALNKMADANRKMVEMDILIRAAFTTAQPDKEPKESPPMDWKKQLQAEWDKPKPTDKVKAAKEAIEREKVTFSTDGVMYDAGTTTLDWKLAFPESLDVMQAKRLLTPIVEAAMESWNLETAERLKIVAAFRVTRATTPKKPDPDPMPMPPYHDPAPFVPCPSPCTPVVHCPPTCSPPVFVRCESPCRPQPRSRLGHCLMRCR